MIDYSNEKKSIIYNKSFSFSLKIISAYKHLLLECKEFILSKQLLRSGTSIGANVSESLYAQSDKDCIAKLHIALKEASETEYWIKLMITSKLLEKELGESLLNELYEIIKILYTIIKNKKEKIKLSS